VNRTPEQRNKSIWRWIVISVSVFALLLASGPAMSWLSNSPTSVVAAKGVQEQKAGNGNVTKAKNNGNDDKKTKEPKPTKEAKDPKPTKEVKEPKPTKEPHPTKEAEEPKPTKEPKEHGGGCQFAILSFKACIDADRCAAYSIPLKNEGDTPITVNGTVVLEGSSNSQIGEGTIGDVVVPPKSTIYVEGSVCATQAGQGPYKLYVTINNIDRVCESKHKQQPVKDYCDMAPLPPTSTATAVRPTNTAVVPPTSTNTAVPTNTTAPATATATATYTAEATNTVVAATNTSIPTATTTATSTDTPEANDSTATSTATATVTPGSGAVLGGSTGSNAGGQMGRLQSEVLPLVGEALASVADAQSQQPREGVLGVTSEQPAASQASQSAGLLPVTGALGVTLLLMLAGVALALLGAGLILKRRRSLTSVETSEK
jgi:hypothetical protein